MANEPISGKDGSVEVDGSAVLESRKWTLKRTSDNKEYASTETGGNKKRVAGIKDWSGSIDCYAPEGADVTISEGQAITVTLKKDATHSYAGPAIVDDIDVETDIEGGELTGVSIAFSGNGALTTST